ncbi:MAG: type II secretion system protein [Cetobacterium somerae]
MKKKKNKGFSVIEIVLVLGVIGILSSFIAPKVRDYLALAKDSKAINTLQSLRMANETYYLENGNYPSANYSKMSEILKELEKYIGIKVNTDTTELFLDIGGSKSEGKEQQINYGGKIKVVLDNEKGFKLNHEHDEKILPFNMRGDKWSEL